jgi:pentatricopeptide repeat protein
MVLHAYAAYPHDGNLHAAHRVMALQERTPRAPPLSPVAYSILLKAYGTLGDMKNVEICIHNAMRNGIMPDIVMANTVVDAYVNSGLIDDARNVVRSMSSTVDVSNNPEDRVSFWSSLRPNARTYNTVLKGMAGVGDVVGAMKLSGLVKSYGLWDEITTNTLVKAAVTACEYDLAEDILSNHTVIASRIPRGGADHPNVEAYTELLDGYAKDGQLENSLRVMQLMQRRGVTPNEYTYTCMVGALARSNKVRQARKMIDYASNLASNGGRRLDLTPAHNAFISGLLSDNRNPNSETTGQSSHAANMVEVLAVFQEMLRSKIHPNVVTVALVVDGLGRCNPPRCKEARELVEHVEYQSRLRQKNGNNNLEGKINIGGISLSNNKIATVLIQAYGRANDVESAIDSFTRIASPDVVAFNALLDACCRCDRLKLALDMFKKYARLDQSSGQDSSKTKTRNLGDEQLQTLIRPDVVTYTTLISALLQLKSRAATKRAISLYGEMKSKWWISPDTVLVDA